MSWKPAIILGVLAIGGFAVAKVMIDKDKKAKTVGGVKYRATVYQGDGGYLAQIFVDNKPTETIGPLPTSQDAADQAAAFIAGLDAAAFYTVRMTDGRALWVFDGWSRGTKISEGNGPYASEQAAMTAGSTWVASQGEVTA